ncbi:hypothetical protein N7539_004507 [Penicillium diatomitis]|uniref:Uncharacterized protein n=1 Tax=Penicillium diatomitis TaxID=2819901 RepID=A0A9W9XE58_9EURO|nr:uncharacterized protein N7539_004507 [Penicillium diatomitis]KAJ5489617.1 hypothetical protein N7539_004507 [Penicillium diatomitis]
MLESSRKKEAVKETTGTGLVDVNQRKRQTIGSTSTAFSAEQGAFWVLALAFDPSGRAWGLPDQGISW